MNLSELCIRRPVMVVLLSATLILAGVLAYFYIPVAALPSYNTPVINVSADLPGFAGNHGVLGGAAAGEAVLHHRRPV
jgi:HAE1 family hydrophobic/amphiphilic exporter-1